MIKEIVYFTLIVIATILYCEALLRLLFDNFEMVEAIDPAAKATILIIIAYTIEVAV